MTIQARMNGAVHAATSRTSSSLNVSNAVKVPEDPLMFAFGFELVPYHGRKSEKRSTPADANPTNSPGLSSEKSMLNGSGSPASSRRRRLPAAQEPRIAPKPI